MPTTVAFWNVNMGVGSSAARRATFDQWCAEMPLDILFLEEVSYRLDRNHVQQLTGMTEIGRVGTLDIHDQPTTKDLATLTDDPDVAARPLRFPGLEQRRLLLKAVDQATSGFAIWGIHANASRAGGRDAVDAVNRHLASPAGAGTVVGGDFNCPIGQAGASAVRPVGYAGAVLTFTQWNKTDGTTALNQYGNNTIIYRKIEPHGVIDYAIHGPGRGLTALPNCTSQQRWTEILREFDHCPVVYSVT